MIKLNIDVTKIEKKRLFEGKKGTYLDCVLIETPNSEYGDYMIVQDISKEEREQGIKGPILGNGKNIQKKPGQPSGREFPESGIDDLGF
jgi:hypothetical protein